MESLIRTLKITCFVALIVLFNKNHSADLFSASVQLESLLDVHKEIILNLEDHIKKAKVQLQSSKKDLKYLKRMHKDAIETAKQNLSTNSRHHQKPTTFEFNSKKHTPFQRAVLIQWALFEEIPAGGDVEQSIKARQTMIDNITSNLMKEKKNLRILTKFLNKYKREHKRALEDISNYFGNPLNAFTLIKRLTVDLEFMENITNVRLEQQSDSGIIFPTYEDLEGAALALSRLQVIYGLNVTELAEGWLKQTFSHDNRQLIEKTTPLSASDCYELGRSLYDTHGQNKRAIPWFMEALRKYRNEEPDVNSFREVDIVKYISITYHGLNNSDSSSTNQIREHENIFVNFEEHFNKSGIQTPETQTHVEDWVTYAPLCRGEFIVSEEITKRLKCRYVTENHPFLRLAPIKMEQLFVDPEVILFHDVISDDEIRALRKMAQPKLYRSRAFDRSTEADYRVGKSAWLEHGLSPVVSRVSRRVAHLSGLSVASAEPLQVTNYGIGGHYESHFDYFSNLSQMTDTGNRIATVLFYISDVAAGGATVFPELGLTVFPVKGTALFWYNLLLSGERDVYKRHAACPVLRGHKWVANMWIHELGQEFLRPCNLQYQDETFKRKIPQAIFKTLR